MEEKPILQVIDHSSTVLWVADNLCMSSDFSDVTFLIDGQRFPAHRIILAARFEYFRIMLYGGFSEAQNCEIKLDVNPDTFQAILKYVYTGILNMELYTVEELVDVLHLAKEYCFDNLVSVLLPALCKSFDTENYGLLMNVALLYSENSFYDKFLDVLDKNASHILQQKCFILLNKEALADILKRDTFSGYELDIFKSVMKWSKTHTEELKYVLPHIRFNLMQIDELQDHVLPTGVLTEEEIDVVIKEIKTLESFPLRAGETHRSEQNFLTLIPMSKYGDALKISEVREIRHPTYFKLPRERMINHLFMDLGEYVCSYHIEISTDCRVWKRIIDYSKHKCYSEQFLYFELVPVFYICIVPYYMEKECYRIGKIETDYKRASVPMLIDGFVAPIYNFQRGLSGHQNTWKYDSNIALTTFSQNCTDANFMTLSLHQPLHINSLQLCSEHSKFTVSKIESALEENNFTELSHQSDAINYFNFEAHLFSFLRITFSHRPNPGESMKIILHFNPSKTTGPLSNWNEYLAEVRRTGQFLF